MFHAGAPMNRYAHTGSSEKLTPIGRNLQQYANSGVSYRKYNSLPWYTLHKVGSKLTAEQFLWCWSWHILRTAEARLHCQSCLHFAY